MLLAGHEGDSAEITTNNIVQSSSFIIKSVQEIVAKFESKMKNKNH